MRFCFIVEEQYRNEAMPMVVIDQLIQWGYSVDLLEPANTITCLDDLARQHYDAYILKTVSDGPGLSILEAAEAIGIPTINNSHAIRLVRDKAIASALASAHGLPTPRTYFVAQSQLLSQIPETEYPLVIKPSNGSSGRNVYRIDNANDIQTLAFNDEKDGFLLAQHYIENTGFDIKLYVIGEDVYPVAKKSPLHPEITVDKQPIPLTHELRDLALRVGALFGLDIYGLDVVETPQGWVVVDVNDFPGFGQVPQATPRIAKHIIRVAQYAQYTPSAPVFHRSYYQHTVACNSNIAITEGHSLE